MVYNRCMIDESKALLCILCNLRPILSLGSSKRKEVEAPLYCFLCWRLRRKRQQYAERGTDENTRRQNEYRDRIDPLTGIRKGRIITRVQDQINRAQKIGCENTLTYHQWIEILLQSDGKCYYCNANEGMNTLVIEHMIPLSRGGTNTASNICAACRRCNNTKHTKTHDQFLRERNTRNETSNQLFIKY